MDGAVFAALFHFTVKCCFDLLKHINLENTKRLREKLKLNYYTPAVNQFIYLTNIMRAISIALS